MYLTIIKFVWSLNEHFALIQIVVRCSTIYYVWLFDGAYLLVRQPYVWVDVRALLFKCVTFFSLILSAETPLGVALGKLSQFWVIADDLRSKLDRFIFERRCHFLIELIGQRAVFLYTGISISNITLYLAYVSQEIILDKNWSDVVVLQTQGLTWSYFACLAAFACSFKGQGAFWWQNRSALRRRSLIYFSCCSLYWN